MCTNLSACIHVSVLNITFFGLAFDEPRVLVTIWMFDLFRDLEISAD
jgi:hypothetical protein